MILSVSRRTDIPAFYSEWFFNRLREGFALVRNPFNPRQVSKISLSRELVDCFVFWTKNPQPMLEKLSLLSGYNYYFQFTLNPYDQDIEVNLPPKADLIKTFITVSEKVGKKRIIWRYDPIFLSERISLTDHLSYFSQLASELSGHTEKCVISFLDMYKKTERNLKAVHKARCLREEEIRDLAEGFARIGNRHSLALETCAEKLDLNNLGIKHGRCIDDHLIQELTGAEFNQKKDICQRKECGCVASIDLGAYNTCQHHCLYCYANYSQEKVMENLEKYNPKSPILCGTLCNEDIVQERKMISCKVRQSRLY